MPKKLCDERSHVCESWPVSNEDTTQFLPSAGITRLPIHFATMDWTFTGFTFGLFFLHS
jgi:hypothetical protein